MSKHISQNKLEKLYRGQIRKIGKEGIEEIKNSQKKAPSDKKNSIFLCHSHLDKTIVNKIALLFSNLKINLYIDWMDTNLPELTDRYTASIIRNKIDVSHKFLFLATYNALRSKWCNWELGIAYSSKGENDFAILPIESKTGKWASNEYLQLYPEMRIDSIDEIDNVTSNDVRISFYENKIIGLEDWLRMDTDN